jgi:hypothetical protein
MQSATQTAPASKWMLWAGYIVSALPVPMLLMSGVMKLIKPDFLVEQLTKLELPASLLLGLGILELVCTAIYVIPRTAVLGAILLTGYFGGAILTHVRIGEWFEILTPIVLGVMVWGGLYLRDERVRAILPLRG